MRLDFNVLCVDDQPQSVAAQFSAIGRDMEAEGFHFSHTLCTDIREVRSLTQDQVFNDEIDLIMVDWDLGDGLEGQSVIEELRHQFQYKDVVFYSGQKTPRELREFAVQYELDGVYFSDRAGLREQVTGVFHSLIKKVLDLDHTRGIVMGATSDIDFLVDECLNLVSSKLGKTDQISMTRQAFDVIRERLADHSSQLEKLRGEEDLAKFVNAYVCTAYDRLRVLSRILDLDIFTAHKDRRNSVTVYMQQVVPKRNDLAHKITSRDGKAIGIALKGGKRIGIDEMRDLRRLILGLRTDFRTLLSALQE